MVLSNPNDGVDPMIWDKAGAIEELKNRFGIGEELIATYFHPYVYLYVVFQPNRFINDFDGLTVAATHGSPWRYDTYVPIIFAGIGIPAQRIDRMVHTVDIAPTLSLIVGAKPPTGSFGAPLNEVIR